MQETIFVREAAVIKIICVDDETHVLRLTVSQCRELPQDPEVEGFERARDALDWLEEHTADVALLDINMPDMDGLALAAKIKERSPDTAIIFLTGYAQYAVDAFRLHPSGYVLKPVSLERLTAEMDYALSGRTQQSLPAHIAARTFGGFDLFVDGKVVVFSRSKAKELLAYLIDRQGESVTRAEAFAALWENKFYDRSQQKYLDIIIRSLRETLSEYGVGEILEMRRGALRILPAKVDCDLYRFFDGDVEAVNAYRGEYMSAYSWASLTEAYVTHANQHLYK